MTNFIEKGEKEFLEIKSKISKKCPKCDSKGKMRSNKSYLFRCSWSVCGYKWSVLGSGIPLARFIRSLSEDLFEIDILSS